MAGVRLFAVDHDPSPVPDARALDADERIRAARFVRPADRDRFIRRRVALRELLAAELDCGAGELSFAHGPYGKPEVRPPHNALQFSTSTSAGLTLIGIAEHPIGLDIEAIRPDRSSDATAAVILTPAEWASWSALSVADRVPAFFVAWTRKEALIKASGLGVGGCPPDRLDVTFVARPVTTFHPQPGFVAAVADAGIIETS